MSEFKGTPGPWEVGVADWSENGDARYSLVGAKEICINDARLIAAAPDLLEALKLAEEVLCKQENAMRSMGCYEPCPEVAILTARDAIAKSTGADQ